MGILEKLLSAKNVEAAAKALEDGVEKIVQYGQRTLKVMKPKTQVFSYYNGGMSVPKSMEGYYAKAGMNPTGHYLVTTKDMFVKKGDTTDKLVVKEFKGLDGSLPLCVEGTKTKYLVHNYGTKNAYQNMMDINSVGKRTFYLNN